MKDTEIDYSKRIHTVQKALKAGEILFVFAAKEVIRNRDVEYKFRQNSDFFYLTGIDEKDAILVLTKNDSILFCLPRDKSKEIWTGARLGKYAAKKKLRLSEAYDLTDFPEKLPRLLEDNHTLYHFFGFDPERDYLLLRTSYQVMSETRDGRLAPERFIIPNFLHELRLHKSREEISYLKESARITAEGHIRLMKESKPGMYEYELEAKLEETYLRNGAWGGGYNHIVASGKNACVLHYTKNNSILKSGDLILIDSGAEKNYYTADVTRTFPISKKFSPVQKSIYEIVLASQKNAIQLCKAGNSLYDIHDATVRFLSECLIDLRLLKGSLEKVIERKEYKRFFMHRIGHYLGMDVHDVGKYFLDGERRSLKNGMVVTIEPGLYFDPLDTKIPSEFRGIGIRIEDDILIQGSKPVVLTESIPKEIQDIEALREEAFL